MTPFLHLSRKKKQLPWADSDRLEPGRPAHWACDFLLCIASIGAASVKGFFLPNKDSIGAASPFLVLCALCTLIPVQLPRSNPCINPLIARCERGGCAAASRASPWPRPVETGGSAVAAVVSLLTAVCAALCPSVLQNQALLLLAPCLAAVRRHEHCWGLATLCPPGTVPAVGVQCNLNPFPLI